MVGGGEFHVIPSRHVTEEVILGGKWVSQETCKVKMANQMATLTLPTGKAIMMLWEGESVTSPTPVTQKVSTPTSAAWYAL